MIRFPAIGPQIIRGLQNVEFNWETIYDSENFKYLGYDPDVFNMFLAALNEKLRSVGLRELVIAHCPVGLNEAPSDRGDFYRFVDSPLLSEANERDIVLTNAAGDRLVRAGRKEHEGNGEYDIVNDDFNRQEGARENGWTLIQYAIYTLSFYYCKHDDSTPGGYFNGYPSINSCADGGQSLVGELPSSWPQDLDYYKRYLETDRYIPKIFRRKFPREIYGFDDPGEEGQVARFILRNGVVRYLNPDFGSSSLVTSEYLQRPPTLEESYASGTLCWFHNNVWSFDNVPATDPDLLEDTGLISVGDYFGPWNLNDMKEALDMMDWTFLPMSGTYRLAYDRMYTGERNAYLVGVHGLIPVGTTIIPYVASYLIDPLPWDSSETNAHLDISSVVLPIIKPTVGLKLIGDGFNNNGYLTIAEVYDDYIVLDKPTVRPIGGWLCFTDSDRLFQYPKRFGKLFRQDQGVWPYKNYDANFYDFIPQTNTDGSVSYICFLRPTSKHIGDPSGLWGSLPKASGNCLSQLQYNFDAQNQRIILYLTQDSPNNGTKRVYDFYQVYKAYQDDFLFPTDVYPISPPSFNLKFVGNKEVDDLENLLPTLDISGQTWQPDFLDLIPEKLWGTILTDSIVPTEEAPGRTFPQISNTSVSDNDFMVVCRWDYKYKKGYTGV
jgi:hypothetical protein